jgi:diacylglycerol kinase family enzyme
MDEPRHALVVYNPTARSAAEPDLWLGAVVHRLCEQSDCVVSIRATRPGLAPADLISSKDELDLVVVAGGDGTIQQVVGALADKQSQVPVSIIPVGTGNQLARNLGLYTDNLLTPPLERAIKAMVGNRTLRVDLGRMNGEYFTVAAGAGPISDAVIMPGRDDKTNWKMLAYAGSMVQTFAMPPVMFKVTADGESFQVLSSGIFVVNVADLGVGVISQNADLTDGYLDLCILNPTSFTDYVELGFRFAGGFVGGEAPYYIRKVKTVDIEVVPVKTPLSPLQKTLHKVRNWISGKPNKPPPIHRDVTAMIDGDAFGTTPMHIEVIPNAVNILIPPEESSL